MLCDLAITLKSIEIPLSAWTCCRALRESEIPNMVKDMCMVQRNKESESHPKGFRILCSTMCQSEWLGSGDAGSRELIKCSFSQGEPDRLLLQPYVTAIIWGSVVWMAGHGMRLSLHRPSEGLDPYGPAITVPIEKS